MAERALSVGGRCQVQAHPGQGTRVTVEMPRDVSPRRNTIIGEGPKAAAPMLPRRILLVDDDRAVREVMSALLRASGHTVVEADGGPAGIARLADSAVDIVLTDLRMPEVTGWEVAQAAKRRTPSLPVILISGFMDHQMPQGTDPVPMVDRVLHKPVKRQEILSIIADLTGPSEGDPA